VSRERLRRQRSTLKSALAPLVAQT